MQTPSRKCQLNSNWLTIGKECGSILSSHLWGGALRHDTKNGSAADYLALGLCVNHLAFPFCRLQFSVKCELVNNSTNAYKSIRHNYQETMKTKWIEKKKQLGKTIELLEQTSNHHTFAQDCDRPSNLSNWFITAWQQLA